MKTQKDRFNEAVGFPVIPPAAAGGYFKSNLVKTRIESLKYPQRQLGDYSDQTYGLSQNFEAGSTAWAETHTARLNLNNPPASAWGIQEK